MHGCNVFATDQQLMMWQTHQQNTFECTAATFFAAGYQLDVIPRQQEDSFQRTAAVFPLPTSK